MWLPAVVSTPSVQNKSLIASGTPSSAPVPPSLSRASAASAILSATSGVSVMNAFSSRARSIASKCARAISRAENLRAFSPSRAPAMVRSVSSAILFDHLGNGEISALDAAHGLARVGEDLVGIAAVGDDVVALRQHRFDRGGHRLDALGLELVQLLDPGEDVLQLA